MWCVLCCAVLRPTDLTDSVLCVYCMLRDPCGSRCSRVKYAHTHNFNHTGTSTRLSEELCSVALTREEVGLAEALLARVSRLAEAAAASNVRLMIDAEHQWFQNVRAPLCGELWMMHGWGVRGAGTTGANNAGGWAWCAWCGARGGLLAIL